MPGGNGARVTMGSARAVVRGMLAVFMASDGTALCSQRNVQAGNARIDNRMEGTTS
jgi:hypothetical protein